MIEQMLTIHPAIWTDNIAMSMPVDPALSSAFSRARQASTGSMVNSILMPFAFSNAGATSSIRVRFQASEFSQTSTNFSGLLCAHPVRVEAANKPAEPCSKRRLFNPAIAFLSHFSWLRGAAQTTIPHHTSAPISCQACAGVGNTHPNHVRYGMIQYLRNR